MSESLLSFIKTEPAQLHADLEAQGSLASQRGSILNLLSDGLPHRLGEVRVLAAQYNARIFELRRIGFGIKSLRQGNKTYFQLVREGEKE